MEVLVNLTRWKLYSTTCHSLASEPTPIIDALDIHTSASWQASLLELLPASAVNETFLFHGTKPFLVDTILRSGLKNTISQHSGYANLVFFFSRFSMLGFGLYLADSASKSDEYAEEDENGLYTMFLVRTALGRPYHSRGSPGRLEVQVTRCPWLSSGHNMISLC